MRAARWLCSLLVALTALACATPQRACAQAPLAIDRVRDVAELAPHVAVLFEDAHALTLADVRARDGELRPNEASTLSFGFHQPAVWLRFTLENRAERVVPWRLELAEPTLDYVTLYVVHEDGRVDTLQSGDALPFAERAIGHASFVFPMEAAAHERATLYLRAQSADVLRVPLRAWTPRAYEAHHDRETFLRACCVGALLLVALYQLGVYVTVRQLENAWYAAVALSLVAVLMSLDGYLGQWFFPAQPALANRMPAVSIAVGMLTVAFFTHAATERLKTQPRLSRLLLYVALSAVLHLGFVLAVPTHVALVLECVVLVSLCVSGPYLLHLARRFDIPELHLYTNGWYALIVSIPVAVLRYAGVWLDDALSYWVLPLGLVAYGVLNSLALAGLAGRLRRQLAAMNDRLVANVEELRQALVQAEEANEKAQRATRAKDEFLATMSHELRTPLNTIINIPQGLAGEYEAVRSARCRACDANFLLDLGEVLAPEAPCEACGARAGFEEGSKVRFRGDEARALGFLRKIERSGQHLLQMVNGVLDYSKLEAGRFQLNLGELDLYALLHEVVDQMSDIAQAKGIALEIAPRPAVERPIAADALRLKQVLINLVANAIKFSESSTTVTLRWLARDHLDLIEVSDQGIGIAPEDHERVFTSFEQVHTGHTRKYGGTGLGLSISRSLVRMHAGELSLRSQLGQGATFLVSLPRMVTGAMSLPQSESHGRAPDAPSRSTARARPAL